MPEKFRYRFGSDTNTTLFGDALRTRGAPFQSVAWDVVVDGYFEGLEDLVRQFGGWVISRDTDFETTDGGTDAGPEDMAAASVRANPPENSRGGWPLDSSEQIVSQGGFPPRRATWGQPLPAPVAGINKTERRR